LPPKNEKKTKTTAPRIAARFRERLQDGGCGVRPDRPPRVCGRCAGFFDDAAAFAPFRRSFGASSSSGRSSTSLPSSST